jgi:hypothetical protein
MVGYLTRIMARMAELGHGGIVAVLAPDEGLETVVKTAKTHETAKKLAPPLGLGRAILQEYEAQMVDDDNDQRRFWMVGDKVFERPQTEDEVRDSNLAFKATELVKRWLEQIARLTTVDGAVIMSHSLEVLAFGAKLPSSGDPIKVYAATPGPHFDEEWPLNTHGTRHRAAAAFAVGDSGRLAFIVSQDGDAGTFQEIEGKLVYWPRWTTLPG